MNEVERKARKIAINEYLDVLNLEELQKLEELLNKRDNLEDKLSL